MNVKNVVMNVIAWMTSTRMCTVFVLVILVSVVILKIKGRNVCHVNSGTLKEKMKLMSEKIRQLELDFKAMLMNRTN